MRYGSSSICMKTLSLLGFGLVGVLLLGGCTVGQKVWPSGDIAPLDPAADEQRVRIESQPAGALIVADGKVVGHAPLMIMVSATRYGFFPGRTTIRARFLAEDARHASQSVNAEFGVLDKVPAAVVFTPEGFSPVGR